MLGAIGLVLTRTSKKGAAAPRLAPLFEADLLAGGKFSLAEHRGKHVVLLDFWASRCGPCRLAMPALIDLAEEYKDREVVYYAVNLREDTDTRPWKKTCTSVLQCRDPPAILGVTPDNVSCRRVD